MMDRQPPPADTVEAMDGKDAKIRELEGACDAWETWSSSIGTYAKRLEGDLEKASASAKLITAARDAAEDAAATARDLAEYRLNVISDRDAEIEKLKAALDAKGVSDADAEIARLKLILGSLRGAFTLLNKTLDPVVFTVNQVADDINNGKCE